MFASRDAEQLPEWRNFQFAPKNHYGFFFLHSLPSAIAFRLQYVLFYQVYAKITTFFDQEKFGTAPLLYVHVETFGEKWRQELKNDVITSKSSYWRHARPNHCGRHLGKINGRKSTYVKVWRCTFWWITMFLTEKTLGKIVWMSSWGIWLAYPSIKVLATTNSILWQTARLIIGRCFKLTNSPCIFERRAVTSPTMLVSKGRHCLGLTSCTRVVLHHPCNRRHFLAPVGFIEIPVGFARNTNHQGRQQKQRKRNAMRTALSQPTAPRSSCPLQSEMPWGQLFPSRQPPGQAVLYKAKCHEDSSFLSRRPPGQAVLYKAKGHENSSFPADGPRSGCPLQSELPNGQLFTSRRTPCQAVLYKANCKKDSSLPADGPQVRLSSTKRTAKRTALYQPTAPMSGCPLQSELPVGSHVRLSSTKRTAKRTALYQPTASRPRCPLQSELSKGQLFPSRWPPDQAVLYKANCQKDSSLPADGHQVRVSSTKRTAIRTAL